MECMNQITVTFAELGIMQSKGANLAGYTHLDVCMSTPWLKIKTRVYKGGKAGCKISEWVSDGSKTISSLSPYTLSNLLQMSASPCHQSSVCSQHSGWVPQPIQSKELFQLSFLSKICQEAVQKNYERQKIFSYMVRSNSVTYSHINFSLCHQILADEKPWPPQNI